MKNKKVTLDQYVLLTSSTLTLLNLHVKEQKQAIKNNDTELSEWYQKQIDILADLLSELKII
jgi:hypothetical protein